jgi:hypothetical protein
MTGVRYFVVDPKTRTKAPLRRCPLCHADLERNAVVVASKGSAWLCSLEGGVAPLPPYFVGRVNRVSHAVCTSCGSILDNHAMVRREDA